MRRINLLLSLLCAVLLASATSIALAQQQTQTPPQSQQQQASPQQASPQQASPEQTTTTPEVEEGPPAAEIESPVDAPADTDLVLADVEEDATLNEDLLRNGRFIPTEEISQDLGVSFPVDI